jgi:AcrR family transcriptional regulator
MGRRRTHGQQTAEALLAAAERLAEAHGPAAVSVRGVADEVGTTTRAVYSLFGSKDGLLVALAAHGFRLLGAQVKALPVTEDPVNDLIKAGAVVFRRFAVQHPVLFRISFQREAVSPDLVPQFESASREALGYLIARFDRLSETGGLRGHTAAESAMYFHAVCEGLAALELRGAIPRRHAPRYWREAIRALLVGLGEA